jgi:16S rRNA (cytosine967-C5)-methyltransferase
MIPASVAGHVLELLMLADRGPGPVDRIVAGFLRDRRYLGSRDRRAISDLLFGIVRHRRYLETLLEEFLRLHPSYAPIDASPRRYVPLLLAYASLHPGLFSALPPPAPEARAIWAPYFRDLDAGAFIGWIVSAKDLPFLSEEPAVDLAVRNSFQDWMAAEWLSRWPEETGSLLSALNRHGPVSLRVNTLKTDRAACRERLASEGIDAADAPYPDTALTVSKRFNQNASAAFKEGWFEVQDIGSQAISLACAPAPGDIVVDACAGAGGKTLHLAALMRNTGKITAIDTDPDRLRELAARAKRAGAQIITAVQSKDFRRGSLDGKAAVVLVDAPCSGSGTIRRNPALKWSTREEDVARFAKRQLELLDSYAPLVRPGGRLVYSTCSLFRGENEDVVSGFLARHAAFRGVDPPAAMPWSVERGEHGTALLLPHRTPTDGFFISVMERSGKDAVA